MRGEGEAQQAEDRPAKRKGHGRNGARLYRTAKHFFYAVRLHWGLASPRCWLKPAWVYHIV
jgi:hypothetical protein